MAKKLSAPIVVLVLGILIYPCFADALGISPPYLKNEHLLPGSYFERTIYLVQEEPTESAEMGVIFSQELTEIKDWLKIEPGLEFTLPAGIQQFPLKIMVQVPQNAQLGKYSGYIWIEGKPEKDQKEQVRTVVGTTISVALTITEKEYSDWQLRDLGVGHLAEEETALRVYLKVENLGNVKTRPSKVGLEVYDSYHRDLLFSGENSELEWVEPFQTKEITAEFSVDLESAQQYWAEIEIYKEGELLLADKRRVNVGEIPTREANSGQISEPLEGLEEPETGLEFGFLKSKIFLFGLLGVVLAVGLGFGIRQIRKSGVRLEIKRGKNYKQKGEIKEKKK